MLGVNSNYRSCHFTSLPSSSSCLYRKLSLISWSPSLMANFLMLRPTYTVIAIFKQIETIPPKKEFLVLPSLLKLSYTGWPNISWDLIKEYFLGVNLWMDLTSSLIMSNYSFPKSPTPVTKSTPPPAIIFPPVKAPLPMPPTTPAVPLPTVLAISTAPVPSPPTVSFNFYVVTLAVFIAEEFKLTEFLSSISGTDSKLYSSVCLLFML